ncbi:AAA family ATPase [Chitinophaga eiseniae]|uniref:ATP-binding protein n=1 Tax=Chitinophaga eiseniae TaxID=634771 RepID=A0A847SG85_9BACT|nr:ATP-binding protein [Chitinophaga eiseniae]NLR78015.1 ATP-binding protein [Chitinophaga eiseniae]
MLIRFVAENILSFHQETEFNMLTGEVRRLPEHVHKLTNLDLLKSAVIYGANGAGKSNLIMAIGLLSQIVKEGDIRVIDSDLKFKLADTKGKPSSLEIEFVVGRKGYAYGISISNEEIVEEWLYRLYYGKKADELIFERKRQKKGKTSLKLHPKYIKTGKDELLVKIYEEDVLEHNVPFIFLVKDKKYKEISEAFQWFETNLLIIFPNTKYAGLVEHFTKDHEFKEFTNSTMHGFHTGIHEIDIQTIDFDQFFGEDNLSEKERVLNRIKGGDREAVGDYKNAIALIENGKPVVKKAITYHIDNKGEKVKFELFNESDGTLRLIDFIPAIFLLNKFPITILIDEIDQSIHASLLKEFISKIQKVGIKGQLIFTTHESNLLDLDLFRQDEIWFAEKNDEGASQFYPLSDYDVRPDLDIRKGYLSGRFGAIPFLGNLRDLNWEQYAKEY